MTDGGALLSNIGSVKAREHASLRCDQVESFEREAVIEEDECNLINKDDFEEGKTKEIVTSRATPINCNALARKN